MLWQLQYTPAIWPSLIAAAFLAAVGFYAWRHRDLSGALPLAWMLFIASFWAVGGFLEQASVDDGARVFWAQAAVVLTVPMAGARLWFALEYAEPGRWITRPLVAFLVLMSAAAAAAALTNGLHHLAWVSFAVDGPVRLNAGPVGLAFAVYAYLLALVGLVILARLYVRSPIHRLPVTLIMAAQVIAHAGYAIDRFNAGAPLPFDSPTLAAIASATLYALAVIRYRMFDPIPIARETVIEQMAEGMLVLDTRQRLVDLNRAAEGMLSLSRRSIGRAVSEILPSTPGIGGDSLLPSGNGREVTLGSGAAARVYALHSSPLQDRRGAPLGTLILVRDITDQKRAQEEILGQQRLVAVLRERQQLARELHDGVAQVLGYVSLQARAIQKWIAVGDLATAEAQSLRLAGAADDAHADVRASIRDLKLGPAAGWSLLAALRKHLDSFTTLSGIQAELVVAPELENGMCGPEDGSQLLRVIQEAMTNVRKHSGATRVTVSLACDDSQTSITVADDGRGFDPVENAGGLDAPSSLGGHIGIATMGERMAQIGGTVEIRSQPGAGTQVVLQLPARPHGGGKAS